MSQAVLLHVQKVNSVNAQNGVQYSRGSQQPFFLRNTSLNILQDHVHIFCEDILCINVTQFLVN